MRNFAYYRSWHEAGQPRRNEQFWVSANGAFLDIAVLEWCKIFGDSKGKHRWAAVVADEAAFIPAMANALGIARGDFETCRAEVLRHRDKFVAHLDSDNTMDIPMLDIAERAVFCYHQHLVSREVADPIQVFRPLPASGKELIMYFEHHCSAARHTYDRILPPQNP